MPSCLVLPKLDKRGTVAHWNYQYCTCLSHALTSRAREDLKLSNQRVNTILADYGDVVPRKDYEALEESCVVGNWY